MVTGIANAYLDRAPVIAITGQLSTSDYPVVSHQRIKIRELYKPITKWGKPYQLKILLV
jgi:acetolactate synthase-1/2/3 large subunit